MQHDALRNYISSLSGSKDALTEIVDFILMSEEDQEAVVKAFTIKADIAWKKQREDTDALFEKMKGG